MLQISEEQVVDMKHILVASDLTDRSERALGRALQLASPSGRLTLLHVVTGGLPEDIRIAQQRSAVAFITRRLECVPAAQKANCEGVIATGCVFSTIIAEAMGRNAELIVIGKAGIHPYADLFTGTTAERVVPSLLPTSTLNGVVGALIEALLNVAAALPDCVSMAVVALSMSTPSSVNVPPEATMSPAHALPVSFACAAPPPGAPAVPVPGAAREACLWPARLAG
jgi:nucleotide-binding universal stress UspA family protein